MMDKTALLLEAAEILNTELKIKPLLANIMSITVRYLNAAAASVFLVNHQTDRLDFYIQAGNETPSLWDESLEMGQGIAGWVASNGQPVMVEDARSDPRYYTAMDNLTDFTIGPLICVPIKRHNRILGVVEAINPRGGRIFNEEDREILTALAGQMAVSLENAMLLEESEKNSREKELLFQVSKKINSFLRLNEVLESILDSLSQVIEFDVATVFLVDRETGEMRSAAEKAKVARVWDVLPRYNGMSLGDGLIGWSFKTGQSVIVPDVSVDARYLKSRSTTASEMVVPIKTEDKVVGVFNIESDQLNRYHSEDLGLLEAFAGQAAVAIERAHLHNEIISKRRIEEELKIARRIQSTFLPARQPELPGFDIFGINHSYSEVGGDYFDFINIVPNQDGIVVADVAGHGIPAALIMAAFRASLIAEIRNNFSIRHILYKVNNLLYESIERANFVTAIYGVLDSQNSVFTFSNAGHNPPLLLHVNGEFEELTDGGIVLGVVPNSRYTEKPIILKSGDLIIFYTDGVTDTFNPAKEDYGQDRLMDFIRKNAQYSAREISGKLYDELQEFRNGHPQDDDYTIIVLKKL